MPEREAASDGQRQPVAWQPIRPRQHQPAISLHEVVKTYVNAAGSFTALKGINLQMNYGQFVSIVGKSGSGKSTLLNMITGIDHPTSGQVIIGGQDLYKMTESQRALWRGRNLGIVFQFFQLLPTLTLLENTMLPMDYCNVYPPNERPKRALELLEMVGLEDQAHKLPTAVSSGQQQSAAIARALATDPPIIVADEPTGNLDSRSAAEIIDLFERAGRPGQDHPDRHPRSVHHPPHRPDGDPLGWRDHRQRRGARPAAAQPPPDAGGHAPGRAARSTSRAQRSCRRATRWRTFSWSPAAKSKWCCISQAVRR